MSDAVPEDAEALLALQKLAFHQQGVLYDDFTLPPLTQTLEEMLRDFDKSLFVKAVYRRKIVGSVRAHKEGATCFIARLAVHPDHQNRGIGRSLMQAAEARFPDVERFELFTGYKSVRSINLYKSLGYVIFKEETEAQPVKLICMEKNTA
ncbi:MAG TPA: GNAT family N-acetyltransferase [Nitrospiraceae bacterium]|nr:GNAT family N-acetyltransferase [Nitrospiraceae bacterium]